MVRPKKSLGQHFLTDQNLARKITESLRAENYDTVIEIGPGKGILTAFLLKKQNISLIPIEIDREASAFLTDHFPEFRNTLIIGDFLKTDLSLFGEAMGIIGNFPYNISSQIFFRILEHHLRVREVVCMIQKEVADRIISPPGNKSYGILSVLLQTWYDINLLFTVHPGSFFPKPAVRSAVIRLVRNNRKSIGCEEGFYRKLVKSAFNQRRKILRNSISDYIRGMDYDNTVLQMRPEQLGVDEFIKLALDIFPHKSNIS